MATQNEQLKAKLIALAQELLNRYETDIESGIEDGTYEAEENIETRQFIAEGKQTIEQFNQQENQVLIFVEGGIVQGASATQKINVTVFDKDNFEAAANQDYFIEQYGHPNTWDAMIKSRTEAEEITPVY